MIRPTTIKYKVYKAGVYKGCSYSLTHNEAGEAKLENINQTVNKKYPGLHYVIQTQLHRDLEFYKDSLEEQQLIKVFINNEFYKDFIV